MPWLNSLRSTSKGRPMRLPARSSSTVSTRSWYSPGRHGSAGIKRHSVSSLSTATEPATGPVGPEIANTLCSSAQSSDSGKRTTMASAVCASGTMICQSLISGETRSEGATRNCLRNPSWRRTPRASRQSLSITRVYCLPSISGGPTSSRGSRPRLIRPGSNRTVSRRFSGPQSS